MEQTLRAIQQAILGENYVYAQQLIQQPILQQMVLPNSRFNLFSLDQPSQDIRQIYDRAVHFLDQQDYQCALYLFRSMLLQILLMTQERCVRRTELHELTDSINQSNLQTRKCKRLRSSQEGDYNNLPESKNCIREFRVDSPELPPAPPTSPARNFF